MINRDSFVYYYMQKSGGRHDPLILIDIMKAFEEWMPDCKVHDNTPFTDAERINGWNDYREELVGKLT
jgi:hypothetical protein